MNTMSPCRLLGLSGSLRRESYCTAILTTLRDRLYGAALEVHRYDDLPYYNEDDDIPTPPPTVADLRARVSAADAVVIVTPEFNHGIPGVLKNALDWISRPHGAGQLTGKPVLTVTSSLAVTGGVRAHAQLNETLLCMYARMPLRPQVVIGAVHQKMREGRLVDAAALAFLDQAVADLRAMVSRA